MIFGKSILQKLENCPPPLKICKHLSLLSGAVDALITAWVRILVACVHSIEVYLISALSNF